MDSYKSNNFDTNEIKDIESIITQENNDYIEYLSINVNNIREMNNIVYELLNKNDENINTIEQKCDDVNIKLDDANIKLNDAYDYTKSYNNNILKISGAIIIGISIPICIFISPIMIGLSISFFGISNIIFSYI